jgi:myosin-light-chain kinase
MSITFRLSGLSPFMGGTDIETMANVTIAKYDFDDEVFNEISEDAKDFIQKLLVKDKEYVNFFAYTILSFCIF